MDKGTNRRYGIQSSWEGIGLIGEIIAALTLVVTLVGFRVSRSQFWLVGSVIAFIVFMAAATIIVSSTT